MRSHPTPTEDVAPDDPGHQHPFDADGDASSDGFILFSLGPAQLDA